MYSEMWNDASSYPSYDASDDASMTNAHGHFGGSINTTPNSTQQPQQHDVQHQHQQQQRSASHQGQSDSSLSGALGAYADLAAFGNNEINAHQQDIGSFPVQPAVSLPMGYDIQGGTSMVPAPSLGNVGAPASTSVVFSQPSLDDGAEGSMQGGNGQYHGGLDIGGGQLAAASGSSSGSTSFEFESAINEYGRVEHPSATKSPGLLTPDPYTPGRGNTSHTHWSTSPSPTQGFRRGSDESSTLSGALQRPKKPNALKLDRVNTSFSTNVLSAPQSSQSSLSSSDSNIPQSHSRDSVPYGSPGLGDALTPQAKSTFAGVPQLRPPQYQASAYSYRDHLQRSPSSASTHNSPSFLAVFSGQEELRGFPGTSDELLSSFAIRDAGIGYPTTSSQLQFAIGGEDGSGSQEPMGAYQRQPHSPVSPLSPGFPAHTSPGSTLSGAFSPQPGSRPGSQGLVSVSSFTSSTGSSINVAEQSLSARSSTSSASGAPAPTMHRSNSCTGSFQYADTLFPSEPLPSPTHLSQSQSQYQSEHHQQHFWRGQQGYPHRSHQQYQQSDQHPSNPQPYDGSSHFAGLGTTLSTSSESVDVAYGNERLSAAIGNNANISSGVPQTHRDGHNTPTILEEEEDQPILGGNFPTSPQTQQQQQQRFPSADRQSIDYGSAPGAPNTPRSHRTYHSNVRPSVHQQLSMLQLGDQSQPSSQPSSASESGGDCSPFIQDIVRQYLSTPSRLGLGERTVMIMTSKVAQKSYGAEKRFLCPPPMALLIGSSWWNACPDSSRSPFHIPGQNPSEPPPTILSPPRLTISISGEPGSQDGAIEWASSSGRLIDVGNPSSEMAISGRCIGKQLFISDVDEKRRNVEALISISVAGTSPLDRRLLGTFPSKPIKVISKPSKKRQSSRNTELCVNHGSTISLFHRLRSQTVSTRYLSVSGSATWFKGSDGQPFPTPTQHQSVRNEPPSCFVAKMSSWDPFIIYLVDPKKRADAASVPMQAPIKGYPPPPPNALPINGSGGAQIPIYYNQPIVLQCLNTAVVSPIMIIRKVDKGTNVLGGGLAANVGPGPHYPREAFGDPVSQLHKIALEVVEDPLAAAPKPTGDGEVASPGQSGAFLACLNESVGMHRPAEPRKWNSSTFSGPSTPTTPLTPMTIGHLEPDTHKTGATPPTSPTTLAAAYAAAQTRYSMAQSRTPVLSPTSSTASSSYHVSFEPPPSSDGGKVKRPRRVSSSVVMQKERAASAAKNRRRGQSLSMVGMQNQHESELLRRTTSFANSLSNSESSASGMPPGAMWSVDVADSDVWTIVGTDQVRYSFHVPPRIVGGTQPTTTVTDASIAHLITLPAPAKPITPLPILHSFIPAGSSNVEGCSSNRRQSSSSVVTLFGENLTPNLFVFFGDWKSELIDVRSPDTILCTPPPSHEFGVPRGRVPIVLIRDDGIIFPTNCLYQC